MVHNIELSKSAEILRRKGKSYSEIGKILNVSKSTLSDWFSSKKWSESVKLQLVERHREKSRNFLVQLNIARKVETIKIYESYREEARLEYARMKKDPLFSVGLSIYWGEGEKTANGRVGVVNTDSGMLQVMIKFFRNTLKVPEEKLRAALFLYDDIDESLAVDYWSKKMRLDRKQFIKTQILKSRNISPKKRLVNGICNLYFSDTKFNIKINEWIKLLAEEMRV